MVSFQFTEVIINIILNPVKVLPVFNSDSRKVSIKGLGMQQVILNVKNEFTVDASAAGEHTKSFNPHKFNSNV